MIVVNNIDIRPIRTIKQALEVVQGFTKARKMPSSSYSIPAKDCNKGSKLRLIKGSVCSKCYALKGNYARYPAIVEAQERRLLSINKPDWVRAMVYLINNKKDIQISGVFRWHDSGDLQSEEHFGKILAVVRATPSVRHWLPTKESKLIKNYMGDIPSNIVIRLSGSMIDGKEPMYKNTSTVTTDKTKATCRSFDNGGECGECRKCWEGDVKNITYFYH
jgi:hypothetical protein